MNEIYQSSLDIQELEIEESLKDFRAEQKELEKSVSSGSMESTKKWVEKKYPPTDSFWWVRLRKTETYSNIPWNPIRLKRTARRCGTNPTYIDSLVMTKDGRKQNVTHDETYYTDQDVFANGKPKFPIKNIEWRIRKILNEDRERLWLKKIPEGTKVRARGEDWTMRDMNWYIIVAADKRRFPRWTLIMTTLWPGRVYDVWSKVHENHIDIYTSWPV